MAADDPKGFPPGGAQGDDLLGDAFDEDILSEIEKRLESDEGGAPGGGGEKVELDKADLPIFDMEDDEEEPEPLPEPEPEPEPQPAQAPPVDIEVEAPDLGDEPAKQTSWLKKNLNLVVIGGVAILATVGGSIYYTTRPTKKPEQPREVGQTLVRGQIPDPNLLLKIHLKPFIVPLVKSSGGRILKVAVSLEMTDSLAKGEVSQKRRLCRDVIYRLLRYRPADEVKAPRNRNLLKSQIKAELNHALGGGKVTQVYFTQFLITG